MKLINVTNQYQELIDTQLQHTDAVLVEVYAAGNTEVMFSQAPSHYELLISNRYRPVQNKELDSIRDFFFRRKIEEDRADMSAVKTVYTEKLIEISIPIR